MPDIIRYDQGGRHAVSEKESKNERFGLTERGWQVLGGLAIAGVIAGIVEGLVPGGVLGAVNFVAEAANEAWEWICGFGDFITLQTDFKPGTDFVGVANTEGAQELIKVLTP